MPRRRRRNIFDLEHGMNTETERRWWGYGTRGMSGGHTWILNV